MVPTRLDVKYRPSFSHANEVDRLDILHGYATLGNRFGAFRRDVHLGGCVSGNFDD